MQVYQPFDLWFGAAMVLLGLTGLVWDIHRALTHQFPGDYGAWRGLGMSFFFVADGPAHVSKAFDLPHSESHRTAMCLVFVLPIMFAIIVVNIIAQVVIRRRKKSGQATVDVSLLPD